MNWDSVIIKNDKGELVKAVAPLLISASRSTDIPAFYSKWFFNRFKEGYISWKNPFNQSEQYVSFEKTRFIIFWTKNPKPILASLTELDTRGIGYYFQFTLNDYEYEGLEPNLPSLDERIGTFIELSNRIGKNRVIWRFDPLILSDQLNIETLLDKIKQIGDRINGYTEKLVFSFVDIDAYKKVTNNLKKTKSIFHEFSSEQMLSFARELSIINKRWNFTIATCAEIVDLDKFGINHNKCVDDELIARISKTDVKLLKWLGRENDNELNLFGFEPSAKGLKDKGQRKECGCIISKDIGMYNTCSHLCVYCYANSSCEHVLRNIKNHNANSQSII